MGYITAVKDFTSPKPNPKPILLFCGFGGRIWQTKRLINLLLKHGYNVRAVDYTTDVLTKGDPNMLIGLIAEARAEAARFIEDVKQPVLLLGISLGVLVAVNIMRRDQRFTRAVSITGGDIVKVAHRAQGPKIWPQTYEQLAKIWESVNMYTDPAALRHTTTVMVLPTRDRLIDPDDVRAEVAKQTAAGNRMQLVERHIFGHIGTIIMETVIFPRRVLHYIAMLDAN